MSDDAIIDQPPSAVASTAATGEQKSLVSRVLSLILIPVLLVMLISMWLAYERQSMRTYEDLETRGQALADLQSEALARPLLEYKDDLIIDLLEALSNRQSFQYARIQNQAGVEITALGEAIEGASVLTIVTPINYSEDGNNPQQIGTLTLQLNHDDAKAELATYIRDLALFIAVVVLLIGSIVFFSFRQISKPLTQMVAVMEKLSKGNMHIDVPGEERPDEIGQIARSLVIFKTGMLERQTLREEQERTEQNAREERRKALTAMADSFEASTMGVVNALGQSAATMTDAAHTMTDIAKEAAELSKSVAVSSRDATANVQTVASAADQLASSVNEISSQVQRSAKVALGAREEVVRSSDIVENLAESSREIGDVVNLINEIAAQTNLLALNATIEAARAGEAGKGFAVVASEVKNLASQTATATDEITNQVTSIQQETDTVVQSMTGFSATIREINDISGSISAAVEEQGASTSEISRNVAEAATGTSQVTDSIETLSTASEEVGNAAGRVQSSADEVKTIAEQMRSEVQGFLDQVRNSSD